MRRLVVSALTGLAAFAFGAKASASEFTFKTAGFGTYVHGEYGLAQRGNASFENSSGNGISFDQSRTANLGGEFGLLFAGEKSIFRVSLELLTGKSLNGVVGSSGGASKFTFDSKVLAFIPEVSMDFVAKQFPESRVLISLGGGVALVQTSNTYTMTGGYGGLSNHTDSGKGQGLAVNAGVAYEFIFADHATLVADLGYRYCKISQLTARDTVTTFSGTYAEGATLKNMDGSDRTLDLGGVHAGIGFRFYF